MIHTDFAICPVCSHDEAHATYDQNILSVIHCMRCGFLAGIDGDAPVFDATRYGWVHPQHGHCPEEAGCYLVTVSDGSYTVAFYYASEAGDGWTEVLPDHTPGMTHGSVMAWAPLPKGCHDLPRPPLPAIGGVYRWGPAWFWYLPATETLEGGDGSVCGPCATSAEAVADLEAKRRDLREMSA
jgi:hypothetical protein